MNQLSKIYKILDFDINNGLYFFDNDIWKEEVKFPSRIRKILIEKIKPTSFFCIDNKPLILFFESNKINDKQKFYKDIWNFNEAQIIFVVSDNGLIEIFNGYEYLKNKSSLSRVDKLNINDKEKLNIFNYFELVSGKTYDKLKAELNSSNRVDYKLLENIESARKELLNFFKNDLSEETENFHIILANSILGKVIFIRYLIDKEVKLNFKNKNSTISREEFLDILNNKDEVIELFQYIESDDKGFNGDLFKLDDIHYSKLKDEHFDIIRNLLKFKDLTSNQESLFQLYDFSIIPIEFISSVYERFIGIDNQRNAGAYYTPLFIVDYILSETVDKKLNNIEHINDLDFCKVLDPACGSGIFLVETLRKIIDKYLENNENIDRNSDRFKEDLKQLVLKNIYGIDKDESAIDVAIFSIYLTILDYLEPPSISNFKFPNLLKTNFFIDDFFDLDSNFNKILKKAQLDFIIGNPPWKRSGITELGKEYIKKRENNEKVERKKEKIKIVQGEILEGFILRVSDFCQLNTEIGFVIKSNILYNKILDKNGSGFRKYFLQEFNLKKVLELSLVKNNIFVNANYPSSVIIYNYSHNNSTENNIVTYYSLKPSNIFKFAKIIILNKDDIKQINQKLLIKFDWIFKILIYGNYLDFNFIYRIREEYKSINNYLKNNELNISTGIHFSEKSQNKLENMDKIKHLKLIYTEDVKEMIFKPERFEKFDIKKIDILKNPHSYKAPMLLIREGFNIDNLEINASISFNDYLFRDSLTSITFKNNIDVDKLFIIYFSLKSKFSKYLAINTFSSIGIGKSRIKNYDFLSLPITIKLSNKYLNKSSQYNLKNNFENKYIDEHDKLFISNDKIYIEDSMKDFSLSKIEKSLINYSLEVSKVYAQNKANIFDSTIYKPIEKNDSYINKYINVFIDRFERSLSSENEKFVVEILYNKYLFGIKFKVIKNSEFESNIVWKKEENNSIVKFLLEIEHVKITENLFVRNDIRGFEKDYFYIFKPNEKRLWHEAIAYLDSNEFADSMLRNGADSEPITN